MDYNPKSYSEILDWHGKGYTVTDWAAVAQKYEERGEKNGSWRVFVAQ